MQHILSTNDVVNVPLSPSTLFNNHIPARLVTTENVLPKKKVTILVKQQNRMRYRGLKFQRFTKPQKFNLLYLINCDH